MQQLSAIDLAVVLVYIVGTTLLGAWFSGRQKDLQTYFVGGRNVGWFLVLVSIVATETSTVTFLSVPGIAFQAGGNLTFLQLALGYLLGRLVVAWLLLPPYFRGECFSAYELLRDRFGVQVQRTASGMFLLTRTLADGLRLFLTALLLHQFTGWNLPLAIAVMGVTTIIYTFLGGMEAVIWTDLIQFVIYILGALVAGWFILHGLSGGCAQFVAVGSAADKFTLFDLTPTFAKPYVLWAGVLGGAFFSMASHGADQLMVQRYLCAKGLKQARLALVASGLVVLAQFGLFLGIGVGLYVLHVDGGLPLDEGTRPDAVFGAFIVQRLPTGLIGLVVAAVLAAAMSTLSSSLNSCANAFVADFYRPLFSTRDDRHHLRISRMMTVIWGVAQMAVAIVADRSGSKQSVVNSVLSVAGFTTGLVLGVFLLGLLKTQRVGTLPVLLGMVTGFTAVLAAWLPSVVSEPVIAWPWFAPIGALTTVGVALLLHAIGVGRGSSVDGKTP